MVARSTIICLHCHLLNLFDDANDSRYAGSFQTVWYKPAATVNGVPLHWETPQPAIAKKATRQ